jgi:hypothetical protein
MKKTILAATFALAASAAGIGAQSQAQSPPAAGAPNRPEASAPTPQRPEASAAAGRETVTIQGCVQKGAASASSTPGAVGTAGASTYTLSNAARPPASGNSAAAGASAAIAPSYRLDADDSKLSGHVGHKVEVTGTVEDRAGSAGAGGSPNATASAPGMAPRLKVDSVKMIAATCP